MKKIKQNWHENSELIEENTKWKLLGVFFSSCLFLIFYIISMLMAFSKTYKKCSSYLFYLAIIMLLPLAYFICKSLFGIFYSEKNKNLIKKLKVVSKVNIGILIGSYIFLGILSFVTAVFTKNRESLYNICSIFFIAFVIIWIFQVNGFNSLLKEKIQKVQISIVKIKIVRSLLVAISGWVLIIVNITKISANIYLTYIYAVTTTIATLTYPSLDLFEFIYKLIEKLEKSQNQKGKEEKKTNRRQRKAKEEGRKKNANRKRK